MPIYEYECCLCNFRFEQRQHFDESAVSACPQCQGKARRVLHPVAIIYKGSGFYTTDHDRGSNPSSPSSSSSPKSSKVEEGTETGKESDSSSSSSSKSSKVGEKHETDKKEGD